MKSGDCKGTHQVSGPRPFAHLTLPSEGTTGKINSLCIIPTFFHTHFFATGKTLWRNMCDGFWEPPVHPPELQAMRCRHPYWVHFLALPIFFSRLLVSRGFTACPSDGESLAELSEDASFVADLKNALRCRGHDDGSLAPLFIRFTISSP